MAVTDWNTTPANNTSISGINVAEGCSPANINNAIRQMMADVRGFYNSTVLTSAIGVTVQGYSAPLASIAGLTTAADKMIYTTGANTYAVTDLTAFGRQILDDADAAAVRTTLGLDALATKANVTTAEIAAATLVTASETIGANNNDTTIPTSAAVKAYADGLPVGGMTLLGTISTTTGTTQTLSGLVLTGYKYLFMSINNLAWANSHTSFLVDGCKVLTASSTIASDIRGQVLINLENGVGTAIVTKISSAAPSSAVAPEIFVMRTSLGTSSTSISVSVSGGTGNFSSGSIRVYGVK